MLNPEGRKGATLVKVNMLGKSAVIG